MNKLLLTISLLMFAVLNIFSMQVKTGNTPVTESGIITEPYIFAGKILNFSGSASAKGAVGYKITLTGGTTINYEPNLANLNFSSGSTSGWQIGGWKETE